MPTIARTGLPHGRVSSDLACPGAAAAEDRTLEAQASNPSARM
jgi:hypothetical protein